MRDRVPAPGMAGRVRVTPEIGSPITDPFFATVEMADNAIDGTELNAANFLADETAEALGVESDDPTVNEAFLRLAPSIPSATFWDSGNLIVNSYMATLLNGWTPSGQSASYLPLITRIGDQIFITAALVSSSIIASGTLIFMLPDFAVPKRNFYKFMISETDYSAASGLISVANKAFQLRGNVKAGGLYIIDWTYSVA